MISKRGIIRLTTIPTILILLLIPLLTSTVAAQLTFNVGALTTNTNAGPTVNYDSSYNNPGPYTLTDDSSGGIKFTCYYNMSDQSSRSNSRHLVELNVYNVLTQRFQSANTGNVFLSAGQWNTGSLVITDTYPSTPCTWNLSVYAECEDVPSTTTVWNTWRWYVTIP